MSASRLPPPSPPTPLSSRPPPVVADPWQALRRLTGARIALGRAGVSLPTAAHLAFQLAHAQARDAVHHALDVDALRAALDALRPPVLVLRSAAVDRATYLQRPDLGRCLDAASRERLASHAADVARADNAALCADVSRADSAAARAGEAAQAGQAPRVGEAARAGEAPRVGDAVRAGERRCDLAVVVADGLSARAVERHATPLLERLLPWAQAEGWSTAPLTLATQARVAIGDEIGERLGARLVLVLIGERPGLSSPDSMGAYLSWMPAVGLTDAQRNCVSNIRPAGLGYDDAAHRLQHLLAQARVRGLSGVALKDETANVTTLPSPPVAENFLLPDPAGPT